MSGGYAMWWTVKKAAKELGVTPETIDFFIKTEMIKAHQMKGFTVVSAWEFIKKDTEMLQKWWKEEMEAWDALRKEVDALFHPFTEEEIKKLKEIFDEDI